MKNFVQPGAAIDVASTPSGGYTAGLFYVYGILGGVAALTSLEAEENVLHTEGVFTLVKTTSQVWALGELLYWDPATSKFTNVPGELTAYGVVAKAAGSADTTGNVKLSGGAPHSHGPLAQQAAIANTAAAAAATAGAATPSAAQVDTGIATAVAPLVVSINDILAKLRLAGVIEDA